MHSTILQCRRTRSCTSRSTSTTRRRGLRNPFWAQPRGVVGRTMTVNGKPLTALDPDLASHTFAIPDLGVSVPLEGVADDAKNQCARRAVHAAEAHRHDHVHVPHGQAGPLPLAVLRAVRGRLPATASAARCRPSGTWTGSSTSSEPMRDPPHSRSARPGRRSGSSCQRDRRARGRLPARAAHAARQRAISRGVRPDRRRTSCSPRSSRRSRSACSSSSCYALASFRQRGDAIEDGPPIKGNARIQALGRRHHADRARASPSTAPRAARRRDGRGAGGGQGPTRCASRPRARRCRCR